MISTYIKGELVTVGDTVSVTNSNQTEQTFPNGKVLQILEEDDTINLMVDIGNKVITSPALDCELIF